MLKLASSKMAVNLLQFQISNVIILRNVTSSITVVFATFQDHLPDGDNTQCTYSTVYTIFVPWARLPTKVADPFRCSKNLNLKTHVTIIKNSVEGKTEPLYYGVAIVHRPLSLVWNILLIPCNCTLYLLRLCATFH